MFAQAQQPPDLTQKSLEDLMDIRVTSVSKREQKMSQAAAAVFVISAEDIRRSGALNVPDVLRMVPGVDVAQLTSAKWAISIRGFNGQYSNKLLVLVDGRTVYNSIFAGVFWDSQNVPLESIDRIEVIRGPGAAVWGSNAVNGVINIITKRADDTQSVYVTAAAGSSGPGLIRAQLGGRLPRVGAYRIAISGLDLNAQKNYAGLHEDGWKLLQGGFRSDRVISSSDSVMTDGALYRGSSGETSQIPVLLPPSNPVIALKDRYSGGHVLSRWDHKFSDRSDLSFHWYFDRFIRNDSTYNIAVNTMDLELQHHIAFQDRHDVVWGVGYRVSSDRNVATMRTSLSPAGRKLQLFSLFAQDEFTVMPERVSVTVGARLEHNDFTGTGFQPSARVVWKLSDKDMVWGAVSQADRTLSRADTGIRVNEGVVAGPGNVPVLISIFGNPNRKNERLTAFDLGYRDSWTSTLSIDVAGFYNRYRDLESSETGAIQLETTGASPHLMLPTVLGNGLYGESHGVEMFANWRPARIWTVSPGFSLLSMHLHAFRDSTDQLDAINTPGLSPRHQVELRTALDLRKGFHWNASAYYVGRLSTVSIPSYTRVDTGLSWNAGERLHLQLVGQNLLKAAHAEFSGPDVTVEPEGIRRAAYGKVEWSF